MTTEIIRNIVACQSGSPHIEVLEMEKWIIQRIVFPSVNFLAFMSSLACASTAWAEWMYIQWNSVKIWLTAYS